MTPGTRGGKARTPGPSESPAFCAAWEAKRAAGETKGMTGSREHYARAFAWGQAAERELWSNPTFLWQASVPWCCPIESKKTSHAGAFIDLVLNTPPKDKP